MTDLDTALRRMLRERADDIRTLPADFEHLAGLDVLDHDPILDLRRRRYRGAWLAAAAVAAVLAVVATALAVRGAGGHHPIAPATHTPTSAAVPSASTTVLPRSPHATRDVSLSWFGLAPLPGYALHARQSEPGYRVLAVRRDGDSQMPIGCNGCESASDYIDVMDHGVFNPAPYRVSSWSRVTVSGRAAYLGTMTQYLGPGQTGHYQLATVAWQYRPGSWALVQGVTAAGSTAAGLLRVADAIRPTESVPIDLPCALGYVPALPVTEIVDDRSEGYAFSVSFGRAGGRSFDVTLWPPGAPASVPRTAANERRIDGRTGYYSRSQGVVDVPLPKPGGLLEIGIAEAGALTATDHRVMDRVVAALRCATSSGAPLVVPAAQAIP